MTKFAIIIIFLLHAFFDTAAFPSELTGKHCDRPMEESVVMMGKAVESNNSHQIKIYRDGIELESGSEYKSDEKLTIKIEPRLFSVVFEVTGGSAKFDQGKCKGIRTTSHPALLTIPLDAREDIVIKAVWAKSYSDGVKLSSDFRLVHKNADGGSEL
jgi:hypothetical protein